MSKPIRVTVTGVAVSAAIPVDINRAHTQISVGVFISATATYGVQWTYDDVLAGVAPTWFSSTDLPPGQTANGQMLVGRPVTALRLNVTASTGSVTIEILQQGMS